MLNAFRHQRFNTPLSAASKISTGKCSTPFGIRDSTREEGDRLLKHGIGAQRLSASEIQHLTQLQNFRANCMCSTPFGIRDSTQGFFAVAIASCICAQRLSASEIQHRLFVITFVLSSSVLNAFRHQRFNTKADDAFVDTRLKCSTPFGIRDSTRGVFCVPMTLDAVLNAFRHQRFNTF